MSRLNVLTVSFSLPRLFPHSFSLFAATLMLGSFFLNQDLPSGWVNITIFLFYNACVCKCVWIFKWDLLFSNWMSRDCHDRNSHSFIGSL